MVAAGYGGLALTGAVWGFAWYFLLTLMRGLQGPLLRMQLQQLCRSGERASVLSLKSLLFRLGFIAAAPAVGAMADRTGLTVTFLVLMTILLALLIPLGMVFLAGVRHPAPRLSESAGDAVY
jgi:predicted MFS family arabinose efflux permease